VAVTVGPNTGSCGYASSWITQDPGKAPLAQGGFVPPPPGGVLAAGGWISLTAQGAPGKTVVINSIAVKQASRSAPLSGDNLSPVCGGDNMVPRYFTANLDSDSPRLIPYMGNGKTLPAFPYRVSEDDPEVFMVRLDTVTCDCRFRLAVNWSSDGRTGTLEIDDHGRPFQVSSTAQTALYCPDTATNEWRQQPGRQCHG
jgi:hypothetical protein